MTMSVYAMSTRSRQLVRLCRCVRIPTVRKFASHRAIYTNNPWFQMKQKEKCHTMKMVRLVSSGHSSKCWKCGTSVTSSLMFCGQCNSLQAPSERINYFELFEVQEGFDLDPVALTVKHKRLQWQLHPDKFSQKDKIEQEHSENYSSVANTAYTTLSQPLSRAKYLLKLKGHPFTGDEVQLDQTFLADVMTLNETLAELKSEKEIQSFANENSRKIDEIHKKLSTSFKAKDSESIKRELAKLKYYCNIEDKIKEALLDVISKK